MRRARGFTLIELMITVAIISGVAAAFALTMRQTAGDKGPAFVRSLMTAILQARQAALSTGQPSQIVLTPGTGGNMATVTVQTQASGNWLPAGTLVLPHDLDLCSIVAGHNVSGGSPTCPLTSADTLCITSVGRLFETTGTTCPSATSAASQTLYVRTSDDKRHWIIPIWGLTALPKVYDRGYTF